MFGGWRFGEEGIVSGGKWRLHSDKLFDFIIYYNVIIKCHIERDTKVMVDNG